MDDIKDMLEKNKIEFKFIHHAKPVYSAEDGANLFNIKIEQTAPNLIIYTDIGFYSLIISGIRDKVDFKIIKKLLKCNDVRLATKDEVKQVTGFSVGSVALFSKLTCIVDKKLLENDFIYGGTGKKNYTLKVQPEALFKLNRVVEVIEL
ncbi:MAG: YbaK/EbsC family protein [Clostridium sp.]|uniref:aminoacyl-tRNA deacylase n=1 Tax=Clostridium sp. TaxID=1506 RepID=UPI0039EABA4F